MPEAFLNYILRPLLICYHNNISPTLSHRIYLYWKFNWIQPSFIIKASHYSIFHKERVFTLSNSTHTEKPNSNKQMNRLFLHSIEYIVWWTRVTFKRKITAIFSMRHDITGQAITFLHLIVFLFCFIYPLNLMVSDFIPALNTVL